jgi:hypothetical protein
MNPLAVRFSGKRKIKLLITYNPVVNINDIAIFDPNNIVGGGKGNNDKNNKLREDVLVLMSQMPLSHNFMANTKWQEMKAKFDNTMRELFTLLADKDEVYDKVILTKAAGRGHNHDFAATFLSEGKAIKQIDKLEFKTSIGNSSLENLPQVLSLATNTSHFCVGEKYESFFYDNYFRKVLDCYGCKMSSAVPTKQDYLKQVAKSTYDGIFLEMKKQEQEVLNEKSDLCDASIDAYLNTIGSENFNSAWLESKIISSQDKKYFLVWTGEEFVIKTIPLSHMKLAQQICFKANKKGFKKSIVVSSSDAQAQWELLLRWRNHKGIKMPAWQISYHTTRE